MYVAEAIKKYIFKTHSRPPQPIPHGLERSHAILALHKLQIHE